jgi:hypothetical protein
MISLTKKHWFYYLVLFIVLGIGLVVIAVSPNERDIQMGVVVLMALFYIVWAVIHHLIDHDMHAKVMLEYILIGMVGISVVYFVLTSISP